jgi:membrane protease YdiL (CAAX protease family)
MHQGRSEVGRWPTPVPWTAREVLLSLFFVFVFWGAVCYQTLQVTGFYRWYYGPGLANTAQQQATLGLAVGPGAAETMVRNAQFRMVLWATLLAFPCQIASVLFVCNSLSGTRPEQLGLTGRRFGRNLLLGLGSGVILVTVVFGLNKLVTDLYQTWTTARPEEHPFTQLAQQPLFRAEIVVMIVTAVALAPVMEELVFRGLLQPWFGKHPWGGGVALGAALLLALAKRWEQIAAALPLGPGALLTALAPALFIVALVPPYLLLAGRARTTVPGAIFGTSALFAAMHAFAWPTPVALFVFALGLGYLAYRTQSLVAPVVVHALLNGISCIELFRP